VGKGAGEVVIVEKGRGQDGKGVGWGRLVWWEWEWVGLCGLAGFKGLEGLVGSKGVN